MLSQVLPISDNYADLGLLLVYFLILNVVVMALSIALGVTINGCWMLWKRAKRAKKL